MTRLSLKYISTYNSYDRSVKNKRDEQFSYLSLGLQQSIRFSVSKRLFLGEKRVIGFKGKARIVTAWITVFYKITLSIRNT